MRGACLVVLVVGCSSPSGPSDQPSITGDECEVYTSATSCASDRDCRWYGTGCACPPGDPSCGCSSGACASIDGSGSDSGSATSGAACACLDGGVCFEETGSNGDGPIECATPATGSGDPCARLAGEGSCVDSTTVTGLCTCSS